ncbi:MAG: DUF87 domain-containing protein, partial [Planctomycetes bacterium]|nr:DUF87 domain-containing protein [Planctomycetota bacterium]
MAQRCFARDASRRHVAIIGKTGQGKTMLIQQMLVADIQAAKGVGVIDPHGDLAEAVLSLVPKHRTNDVVLFDAGDADYPLAFNVLACPSPRERPLVAFGIIGAFKKAYADSWGPRLEHILRDSLLALLETPGATLVSVLRLLSETKYRAAIAEKLCDPIVRAFWQRESASWQPTFQAEAVAPIQNKIGAAISSPVLRNIFGQARGPLELRAGIAGVEDERRPDGPLQPVHQRFRQGRLAGAHL